MRSLALMGCLVLAATALPQDYTVERSYYSVEYRNHVDSALLRESANLLLSGPENEYELVRRAKHETGEKRRAALAVMLYSGHPKFLPILLAVANEPKLYAFAAEAVTINPEAAWPILWKLARSGNAGVVHELFRYSAMKGTTLDELSKSRFPDIREQAILNARWSTPHAIAALSDPDWGVCRAGVNVLLSTERFDRSRLYFHKIDRVRVFAAELSQRGTPVDLHLWARIARDPHPDVRFWAMYMLGSSSLTYSDKPGRIEAIRAVGEAIEKGPARVRTAGVHAVRGWLYRWEVRLKQWTAAEIAAVRPILRSRAFRDTLYEQRPQGHQGSPPSRYYVTMSGVTEAAAIAGDPRALEMLRRERKVWASDSIILAHAYLPADVAMTELRQILGEAVKGSSVSANNTFSNVLRAMARLNRPAPADQILAWITDPATDKQIRNDLLVQAGNANDDKINEFILNLARQLDSTAIFALINVSDPRAEQLLIELSKSEDRNLSRRAALFLDNWRDLHKR